MKVVLRIGSFIIGAGAALAVVGSLNDTFPGFLLPLLMGLAILIVVSVQPWFRPSRLALPFCAAITSGTCLTYSLSTKPVSTLLPRSFSHLALECEFVVFLLVAGIYCFRGFSSRKTAGIAFWLLIPILAGCVVGYVSGGIGGANHMVTWMMAKFHISLEEAGKIIHFFRKGVHLSAYGIVGLSLFRGAIAGSATKWRSVGFAMLTAFCIASFDELRQTMAPNRNGSAWDVALDMVGALTFVMIAAALTRGNRPKGNRKKL